MIFPCGRIQFPEVDTHFPSILESHCTNSFFSFHTWLRPVFLGRTCTGFTHSLSEIGKIIPNSNSLRISFITTSFIAELSFLWRFLTGLLLTQVEYGACKWMDLYLWTSIQLLVYTPAKLVGVFFFLYHGQIICNDDRQSVTISKVNILQVLWQFLQFQPGCLFHKR